MFDYAKLALPWVVLGDAEGISINDAKGRCVCDLSTLDPFPVERARRNAAYIVNCVNAYPDLVAMLRLATGILTGQPFRGAEFGLLFDRAKAEADDMGVEAGPTEED